MPRTRASLSIDEIRERVAILRLQQNEGEEENEVQKMLRASPDPYEGMPEEWYTSPDVREPAGQQDILPRGHTRVRLGSGMRPVIFVQDHQPDVEEGVRTDILRIEYNEAIRLWKASSSRETVANAIKDYVDQTGWTCNFAICIRIGSLSRGDKTRRRRSLYQLAAFLDIVMQLQPTDTRNASFPVVFQELMPTITQLDRDFLVTFDVEAFEVLPTYDDNSITVGGIDREKALDRGTFIFEAGVFDLAKFVPKFEKIDPGLVVSSLPGQQEVMEIIQLRDKLTMTKNDGKLEKDLYDLSDQDVREACASKRFRERYDLLSFPDFKHWDDNDDMKGPYEITRYFIPWAFVSEGLLWRTQSLNLMMRKEK